jgi:signal transduction histidine kinase
VEQAKILIVSDDPEFVNAVVQSWQKELYLPEFTVTTTECSGDITRCVVALTDGAAALKHLPEEVALAIAITSGDQMPEIGTDAARRVVQIRRGAGWAENAAVLAQEALLRIVAQAQTADVKTRMRETEHFATLGRFIVEARHGLGNALTSVLGHSELLLMEPSTGMRDEVRAQLETIHAMSLKMHETLHRLSSLEMEMRVSERQAERDILRKPAGAAAQ